MKPLVVRETIRYRNEDGGAVRMRHLHWRGPANIPVFSFQNCRDLTSARMDVVCETPCEAVAVVERTKRDQGTIPSTMLGFARWRVQGNGLAPVGFWCRPTVDENNEHMEFHANWFAGVDRPWVFEGQQSKHHRLTHNVVERAVTAVSADTAFEWQGGTIAVCGTAFDLTRVGDPVRIASVGVEACGRLLVTSGPTTAPQPIVLDSVRYASDRIAGGTAVAPERCSILLRHPGPLTLIGGSLGNGNQPVPRIVLAGVGAQMVELSGTLFGAHNAHLESPILAQNPAEAFVSRSNVLFQRGPDDAENVTPYLTPYLGAGVEWVARL